MMNLEVHKSQTSWEDTMLRTLQQVLFASEALTGNHTLREIAISHADKTMVNHIRPDGAWGAWNSV